MTMRNGDAKAIVRGSCHCGAVRIALPHPPEWVAMCNCSICRRTGTLMAYYDRREVTVEGATDSYLTGDKWIEFRRCAVCGIHTHWQPAAGVEGRGLSAEDLAFLTNRIGVNARLLDGFAVTADGPTFEGRMIEVRFKDNAGA